MIDSETIRAARGGAVDEIGRIPATAAENAADGDSVPLAGISRDTRERIEADAWEAARLDMSRTWEERRDAIVALLDRQAALTESEWDSATANRRIAELESERDKFKRHMWEYSMWHESTARMLGIGFDPENLPSDDEVQGEIERRICELQAKVDELQAELDEYDQTHMVLPVDADGVPIHVGDVVDSGLDSGKVLRLELWADGWVVVFDVGRGNTSRYESTALRHVKPRTLEDVLRDFASRVLNSGHQWGLDAPDMVPEFAAEIRELMANDGEAAL